MSQLAMLLGELEQEAKSTRRLIKAIPEEQLGFKPHAKSMSMGELANHMIDLYDWLTFTINTPELDFGLAGYQPKQAPSIAALLEKFEENLAKGKEALALTNEEALQRPWTLKNGEHVFFTLPRHVVLRNMVFNHLIHHRAQLTVYLRLVEAKVPGMYGPTADDAKP